MYSIKIFDGPEDDTGILIHSPYINDLKAKFKVNLVLQGVSDMTLTINAKNPAWNNVRPLRTLIRVTNTRTGKKVFDGRILKPTQSMNSDGMFSIEYACESKLAYLHDSNQRWGRFQDTTIRQFFTHLIEVHNSQVEPHKRFKVGNVTVTNPTDNVYRYVGYESTFDEIKDNLIDRLGGFLVIREESDGTYLDYLAEVGEEKETPIKLRKNLKDMRREIDPTDVITRVIPLGARLDDDEEEDTGASSPRLDMKSVNDGLDYLIDHDLEEEFGIQWGTIVFDDINEPSYLLTRGQEFFRDQRAARISYDITPVDLSLIDTSFESFELGNYHPIINQVLQINEPLQIIAKQIDGDNPARDKLTIGEKYRTLTEYQVEANKRSRKIVELEDTVNRQSQSLSAIRTELKEVDEAVQQVRFELEQGDLPALEDAIDNLNRAVDNLIEALDEIPVYEPATPEKDGLMSAADKRKLNYLTVSGNINLNQLKQKLDFITVTGPVDLDQLVADVEALKNGGEPEPEG